MARTILRNDVRFGSPRRRRVARGFAVAVLGLLPVAVLGYVAPHVYAEEPGISLAARVPIVADPQDSSNEVMLDPGARRLLYWNVGTNGTSVQEIQAYDLDTFKMVAAVHPTGFQAWMPWALDPQMHVLFHLQTAVPPVLEGIDTRTLQTVFTASLPVQMTDTFQGMYWSAHDKLLYDVYCPQAFVSCLQQAAVAAIDPSNSANPVVWTAALSGCGRPIGGTSNNPAPLGQTKDGKYLYTVCQTNQGSAAVVRLTLPDNPRSGSPAGSPVCCGANTVQLFPGLVTGGAAAMAQWVPNLDRMVTMVGSNGGRGWSAYVFDAGTLHFISAPGLYVPPLSGSVTYASNVPSFGVDPTTGRLLAQDRGNATTGRDASTGNVCSNYADGTNTLAMDETALSGVSVRHFPLSDPHYTGIGKFLGYDPVKHNWWMIDEHQSSTGDSCNPFGTSDAGYFDVYHDSLPAAVPPPAPDPDAQTTDMAEVPGVTGFTANSDASAYGLRYLLGPTGSEGLMAAPTNGGTCDLNADISHQTETALKLAIPVQAPPLPPQYHSFCNSHGRTATFAHVDKVSLDASEARATSISGDTDQETGRDLQVGTDFSSPGLYMDDVSGYANNSVASGSPSPSSSPMVPTPCPAATSSPTPSPTTTPTPIVVLPSPPANEPTTCDQTLQPVQPWLTGQTLPFSPASCGDNGDGIDQKTSSAPLQEKGLPNNSPLKYPGDASVFCSFALQKAEGAANQVSATAAGPLDEPAGATVALVDAQATRTTTLGSVATATATVRDVAIGGFLHIGSLTAQATAQAHGRPRTNAPSYSCTVHDLEVTLPANVPWPPQVPTEITSASCYDDSVLQVISALDTLLSGVVDIEFPGAPTAKDNPPGGAAGVVQVQSPRGYLSQVALSSLDQEQNAIMTDDESIEKPALVVTYNLDNTYSRDRLVASFAGVAAAARYGIFSVDGGGTSGDGGFGQPDTGVLPVLGSTTSAAPPGAVPPLVDAGVGSGNHSTGFPLNPRVIAQAIVDGFRFLFQHPGLIPPLVAVWLLFVGPGYLLSRRRALLAATEGAV